MFCWVGHDVLDLACPKNHLQKHTKPACSAVIMALIVIETNT